MTRPIVIETKFKRSDAIGSFSCQTFYRYSCPICSETGAWHPSLTDAETAAQRHNRVKHPVEVNA